MRTVKSPGYFFSSGVKMSAIAIPTSDFNTDSVKIGYFRDAIMIEVSRSASDGVVSWSLQYSNDGSNWFAYDPIGDGSTQNLSIPDSIIDDDFLPIYVRIAFLSSGSPTGTITASITRVS